MKRKKRKRTGLIFCVTSVDKFLKFIKSTEKK